MASDIVLGARVRLMSDRHRRNPETQGSVVEVDRYRNRDTMVRVQFEAGRLRWIDKTRLVRFGGRASPLDSLPVPPVEPGDVTYLAPDAGLRR
jgi:hypothetical protein